MPVSAHFLELKDPHLTSWLSRHKVSEIIRTRQQWSKEMNKKSPFADPLAPQLSTDQAVLPPVDKAKKKTKTNKQKNEHNKNFYLFSFSY